MSRKGRCHSRSGRGRSAPRRDGGEGQGEFDDIVDIDAGDDHEVKSVAGGAVATTVATTSGGGGGGGGGGGANAEDMLGSNVTKPVDVEKEAEQPSGRTSPTSRSAATWTSGSASSRTTTRTTSPRPNRIRRRDARADDRDVAGRAPRRESFPRPVAVRQGRVRDQPSARAGHAEHAGRADDVLGQHRGRPSPSLDVGDESSITAEGGFVRDQLEFTGGSKATCDDVPFADYRSIKIGVRASTMSARSSRSRPSRAGSCSPAAISRPGS